MLLLLLYYVKSDMHTLQLMSIFDKCIMRNLVFFQSLSAPVDYVDYCTNKIFWQTLDKHADSDLVNISW